MWVSSVVSDLRCISPVFQMHRGHPQTLLAVEAALECSLLAEMGVGSCSLESSCLGGTALHVTQ